jgi:hypothetical protein
VWGQSCAIASITLDDTDDAARWHEMGFAVAR